MGARTIRKGDDWTPHTGGNRPRTGDTALFVRIRCRSRAEVEERQEPRPASWWKRWSHDGGPGDIIEWKRAQ